MFVWNWVLLSGFYNISLMSLQLVNRYTLGNKAFYSDCAALLPIMHWMTIILPDFSQSLDKTITHWKKLFERLILVTSDLPELKKKLEQLCCWKIVRFKGHIVNVIEANKYLTCYILHSLSESNITSQEFKWILI